MRAFAQCSAVLLAGAAACALSAPARANDADFTLKNRTGYQIDEVYVSRHSSNSWGKDVMGSDALADGEHGERDDEGRKQ